MSFWYIVQGIDPRECCQHSAQNYAISVLGQTMVLVREGRNGLASGNGRGSSFSFWLFENDFMVYMIKKMDWFVLLAGPNLGRSGTS